MFKYSASLVVLVVVFQSEIFATSHQKTEQTTAPPKYSNCTNASEAALDRFKAGLRIPTICWSPGNYNRTALVELRDLIHDSYPTIHSNSQVKREIINGYSLLYTITAENPKKPKELPFMFMGHLDVVPADAKRWQYDPFSAYTDPEGFIHARGSVDCKHNIFSLLEALETFLEAGHKFSRDFYIFYGHDEECLGNDGARFMAEKFQNESVQIDWIQDEGAYMSKGLFKGINYWVASIGVAEKGFMTVGMDVTMRSVHSSVPPPETSITTLSRAIVNLNDKPQPHHEGEGPEVRMFEILANYTDNEKYKKAYENFTIINKMYLSNPMYRAMTRTTTAATILRAGSKENTIPANANATVNLRIHPLDTIDGVMAHFRNVTAFDKLKVDVISASGPVSPSCSMATEEDPCSGYKNIEKILNKIWCSDVVAVPVLLAGMTDSRYFKNVTRNTYRFSPLGTVYPKVFKSHGENESISIEQFSCMIKYYSLYLDMFKADS